MAMVCMTKDLFKFAISMFDFAITCGGFHIHPLYIDARLVNWTKLSLFSHARCFCVIFDRVFHCIPVRLKSFWSKIEPKSRMCKQRNVFWNDVNCDSNYLLVAFWREPWSRRLTFLRTWVRISASYTGRTFCHIDLS